MIKSIAVFLWVLALGLAASAQSTTTYLPQVALGRSGSLVWVTHIAVYNTAPIGTSTATVTIRFVRSDGSNFNIAGTYSTDEGLPAGTGNTISFTIPGGGSRFFIMEGPATPLAAGFGIVTSNVPVTAAAAFQAEYLSNGESAGEAGITAATARSAQAVFGILNEWTNTALAIANPNSTPATVTFQILGQDGTVAGSPAVRTIGAENHTALFINELFTGIGSTFFGSVRITTSEQTPVAVTMLLYDIDAGTFSGFPVMEIQ